MIIDIEEFESFKFYVYEFCLAVVRLKGVFTLRALMLQPYIFYILYEEQSKLNLPIQVG